MAAIALWHIGGGSRMASLFVFGGYVASLVMLGPFKAQANQAPDTQDLPARDIPEADPNHGSVGQKGRYISHLPNPCFIVDTNSKIIIANPAARTLFSLPVSLPISTAYLRNPYLQDALRQPKHTLKSIKINVETPTKLGRIWRARFVRCDDGCTLVNFENHTEIINAQKARSDFLANASHELRTPLTAIAGFTETLRHSNSTTPEQQEKFLAIMQKQTARMQRLIEDLLSLSEIETHEFQRPSSRVNLITAINDTLTQVAPDKADETRVIFNPEADTALVYGDTNELTQIIENLVSNARKYAAGSDIHISAGLVKSEDDAWRNSSHAWPDAARSILLQTPISIGTHVWVRVEDNGGGIMESHLPRLGERFYRVDASRSSSTPGTGLGLAIVKHIISRHRGGFGVESAVDRGTAFTFWLPCISTKQQTKFPVA